MLCAFLFVVLIFYIFSLFIITSLLTNHGDYFQAVSEVSHVANILGPDDDTNINRLIDEELIRKNFVQFNIHLKVNA